MGFNAYYFNVSGTFFLTVEQTEMASNLCRHLLKVKKSKGIHIRLELLGYGLMLNLHCKCSLELDLWQTLQTLNT